MLRSLACFVVVLGVASATTFDQNFSSVQQMVGTVQPAAAEETSNSASTHVQYRIRSGETTSKGVNLGSWLVVENWMTSSADFWKGAINASQGEYAAISQAKDPEIVRSSLDYHHSTFINESDIADIAAVGINTVRVPIGYWIVGFDDNDPSGKAEWEVYNNGSLKYLDLLVTNWAKKYNVAVLLSIHAAKGSQNGVDHSSPSVPGSQLWGEFPENVNNTIAMVSFLAERYNDEESFLGFGLLNEPTGATTTDVLYDYYERAYTAVRETGSDCVLVVAPRLTEQNAQVLSDFMQEPMYTNVWVDWHPYFVWGYDDTSDEELVNTSVKVDFQKSVRDWNAVVGHNRLFIGEWSFATNNKFQDNKELFYEFAQAETDVMNQAGGGWTYWSWRLYGDETGNNMWSLRAVLRDEKLREILFSSNSGSSYSSNGQEKQQAQITSSFAQTDQTQQQSW